MSESGVPAPDEDELKTLLASLGDQLKDIKNERGEQKYLDLPTAIKALKDSQEYIAKLQADGSQEREKLTAELERYQADLASRESLEELFNKMNTSGVPTTPPKELETPVNKEEEMEPSVLEQMQALVKAEFEAIRSRDIKESNLKDAMASVNELRGNAEVEVFLGEKAKELGMTSESLVGVAQTSPEAFRRLVGARSQKPNVPQGGSRIGFTEPEIDLKPEKSMIYGANDSDRRDYAAKLRKVAEKKFGVNS